MTVFDFGITGGLTRATGGVPCADVIFGGCAAEAAMICHKSKDKINTCFLK